MGSTMRKVRVLTNAELLLVKAHTLIKIVSATPVKLKIPAPVAQRDRGADYPVQGIRTHDKAWI